MFPLNSRESKYMLVRVSLISTSHLIHINALSKSALLKREIKKSKFFLFLHTLALKNYLSDQFAWQEMNSQVLCQNCSACFSLEMGNFRIRK